MRAMAKEALGWLAPPMGGRATHVPTMPLCGGGVGRLRRGAYGAQCPDCEARGPGLRHALGVFTHWVRGVGLLRGITPIIASPSHTHTQNEPCHRTRHHHPRYPAGRGPGVFADRRARVVEDRARNSSDAEHHDRAMLELGYLRTRGRLANACIGLLTLCGFLIGVTIVLLFLGETMDFRGHSWAVASFLSGVISFLTALVLFFTETVMATRLLNFQLLSAQGK